MDLNLPLRNPGYAPVIAAQSLLVQPVLPMLETCSMKLFI